ncbi:MAG: tape measure protein [Mesorhizobium sp.]|nr:tape measure protein [Mesorhizobium sp.]
MEGRLAKLGAGGFLKNFGSGFVGGIASAFSVQAAQKLIDSATRIQNALKVAGLSGADLTKVYDRLYESAQKNAAPLEALATLYGRAAQQQKELGVSTDQLLQFTDNVSVALRVAGTDAGTASGALLQLGQALGSGVVHAEEFNSILEGVPTIVQAAAAGIKEANGSVAALKQLVIDGKVSSRAFFDGFAAGADTLAAKAANASMTTSQGFTTLTNALTRAAERFDTSTDASKRFGNALGELAVYVDHLNFDGMMGQLDAVAAKLNYLNGLVQDWGGALGRATGAENIGKWLTTTKFGQAIGMTSPALLRDRMSGDVPSADATIQAWAQRTYGGNVTTPKTGRIPAVPKTEPITLADYPVTGSKGKKGGRGGHRATADDRFAGDIQSIKDRTAALREEQATLGMSFFEQQKRAVSLDLEQEALRQVREEARRKGDQDWQNAQLSPGQIKQIDEVSAAYARQADELRKAQEAQDLQRDVLKGVFSDLRSALDDGKFDWNDLANVAMNALDKIIDKIENDLIDSILQLNKAGGSGGGFSLWNLLGLGGGVQMFPGGMGVASANGFASMLGLAGGGRVSGAGTSKSDSIPAWLSDGEYVVNADATRKFRPFLDAINSGKSLGFADGGLVLPNVATSRQMSRDALAGAVITLSPIINVDASNAQPGVGDEVRRGIKQAMADMTPAVVKALKDIKKKGIPV